ncbi:intraflagellar transport protein 57 homolog isoform X4 [Notamacropus eugenii]|uniref:intraflagellar transport protein 57 homolog isoform X4 n=1 Tax=Notamacropus eugenii TaxID=9315 RepID=UPI003B67F40F
MAVAAAVVSPVGVEDPVLRPRGGDAAGEGLYVERGPGAAYHMFVVMEDLVEKLKLLRYEEEILRRNNLKPLSRHYFALPTNPGEQFYMFCTLAAWLINKAGCPFEQPQEYDDPNATISNILSELRSFEEETDNEENFIDLNVLKAQTYRLDMNESAKQEDILESTTDAAEWNLEVERVLPQLKVTIRTDNKDWRIHVDQMHQHKSEIESALKETKGFLDKLHNEISRTLEKISSREKYINNQLEHLVQEYRAAQAQLSEARERYQQGNGGVTERTRILSEITEELEKVKQEMEEKGSSMTDGAPLVKIKQSLTKLKQETVQMDIRIGVVEHTLLQSKLKEKSNMTRDMHATIIPESAIGSY